MNRREKLRGARGALAVLVAAAFLPLVILAIAVGTSIVAPLAPTPDPTPRTISVERVDFQDSRTVALKLVWGEPSALVAPQWGGLVTDVEPAARESIVDHGRVVKVDGVWRIAAHTSEPFYRPLMAGSVGPDVAALNELLARWGYPSGSGSSWSWKLGVGVKALGIEIGAVPSNARGTVAFDPAWFIWIPEDSFAVTTFGLQVGAPAPSAGNSFVEGLATLTSARIEPAPNGINSKVDYHVRFPAGDVPYSGDPADPFADLTTIPALLPSAPTDVTATLERTVTAKTWKVPASTLTSSRNGYCVYVRGDTVADLRPVQVTIAGGDLSATYVQGDLPQHAKVVVNPLDLDLPECV